MRYGWVVVAGIAGIAGITLAALYKGTPLTDLTVPLGAITGLVSYHVSKSNNATTPVAPVAPVTPVVK